MSKVLAWVAIVALILTLGSTLIAIWAGWASASPLLELTRELLSWQVIAGGVTLGAGAMFGPEIKEILKKRAG